MNILKLIKNLIGKSNYFIAWSKVLWYLIRDASDFKSYCIYECAVQQLISSNKYITCSVVHGPLL